ncbi:hypothetical protein [Staphylococcus durrellii]|nr:hypothetical protein [Staphylococcus durrellii]
MGDFFAGYWWLIFPLGGFFYGIFAQIVNFPIRSTYQHKKETLD